MKNTKSRLHRSITPLLAGCISSLLALPAVAVDRIKAANTNPLNVGASWVGNLAPGVNDIAVWNSTVTAPNSSAIGGDLSWMGIRIVDVGGGRNAGNNVVIANTGSSNTLTLGSGGIDMSSAFQILLIQSRITLGASQTWNIANANTAAGPAGINANEDLAFFGQAANIPFNLGGFAVTKLGAGTAAFTSGYTFSNGTFNVNEGVLHIQGGSSRVTTVNNDVTFNVANNGTLRFAAQSGAGGITTVNNGTINLNGGSTLALQLSQNNALNLTGNIVTSGSLTWTTLGGGYTSALATFSGNLSGNGNITYQNTATQATGFLRFTGDNSAFTGTLNVNGASNNRILRLAGPTAGSAVGTWSVAANNVLQVDGVTVDLGTLNGAGNVTNSHTSNVATLNVGAGDFSGIISDGGVATALTKVGVGTLTLTGANTYTGDTIVNGGTLLTTPAQIVATNVTVADGASFGVKVINPGTGFFLTNLNTGATTGSTLIFDTGVTGNPTAAVIDATNFNPNAPTTLKLLGTALTTTVTPFTLLQYETLGGGSFPALSLSLPFRVNGTLVDNVANTSVDVNLTVGIPTWNGNVDAKWDIDSVGDGSTGTANWVSATGPNTYIEAPVGTDAVVFDESATGTTTVDLTTTLSPAGVKVENTMKTYTFTGVGKISGSGALVKNGTGTLTIANAAVNDYSGGTTINAGTVQLGDGATAGAGEISGAIVVNSGGTLELNRPDDTFLSNAISGAGTLKKSQPSVATISGTATPSGSVELAAGTLRFNGGGNLSGVVSGPGLLESAGGTLELSGLDPNTNSGGTTVSAGVLRLNKSFGVDAVGGDVLITGSGQLTLVVGEQIPDTATVTFTGTSGDSMPGAQGGAETILNAVVNPSVATGQLIMRSGFNITGTATVNNGILGIASGSTADVNAINMTSPTAIVRLGAQNNLSQLNVGPGGITASGGEIQVKFNTTNGDAVLNLGGNLTTTGDLTISNGAYTGASQNVLMLTDTRTFDIGAGTTTTVAPAISGSGGLIKAGDGTLTVNGPQSYLSLLVEGGTMNLNTSLANVEITDDGGTLNVNANAINSTIHANDGTVNLTVSQTLAGLNIGADGTVVIGALPPPMEAGSDALVFAEGPVQAVPEPGTFGLLCFGALALLRRRSK